MLFAACVHILSTNCVNDIVLALEYVQHQHLFQLLIY